MIKAAILTPNLSMGGAERWIVSMVRYADPRRVHWTGVALSGWGGCDPDLCRELAQYTRIVSGPPRAEIILGTPPGRQPLAPFAVAPHELQETDSLYTAIKEVTRDAQVLVTWGGHKFDRVVNQPGLPTVLVSHSSHTKPQPLTPKQGVTHLVAVSEAATRPLLYDGNPAATIIHNGVPPDRLSLYRGRSRRRQLWGCADAHLIVGYVGRFSHEKNPGAAIEAVQHLDDRWRAVYYGELPPGQQPPDPDLVAAALQRQDPRVVIRNYSACVGDIYAGLDVLMLASHTEAFSMTMIEAWLAGVPIVSTPVGAVPELEAQHGPLVIPVPLRPTGEQLAAACRLAVAAEGRAIAKHAQQVAQQHWTCDSMVTHWADYLEMVVAGEQPPPGLFTGRRRLKFELDL